MSSNPIPDELRSQHLFLLVGTNPLPDWVAARLLLRNGGQLYLVHSGKTSEVAKRLAEFALKNKFPQPVYVPVRDEHDAAAVSQAVDNQLASIKSDSIGLNYTGGTKVMAVHSYKEMQRQRSGRVVFSYLEATEFLLHIEPYGNFPLGHRANVGQAVPLKLEELFNLHENYNLKEAISRDFRGAAIGPKLVVLHGSEEGRKCWRGYCQNRLKYSNPPPRGRKVGDLRPGSDLANEPLKLFSADPAVKRQLDAVAEALIPGGAKGNKTLGEIISHHARDFASATELAQWLDGQWLEHYTLQQIVELKNDANNQLCLNDYGRNVRINKPMNFEADAAAMCGYQLHLFSCYSGSEDKIARQKLFEVFTHARQLGGEAARAALVCFVNSPDYIKKQIADLFGITEQVKVFGRDQLRDLKGNLQAWFRTGP
jgi:hypothetical protein